MTTPTLGLARLSSALSSTVLNVVLSAAATVTTVDQQLPVETSRSGSIFTDRFDPALRWYLLEYALPDVDPAFTFAASQPRVDANTGIPADSATLTFTIECGEPDDLAAARAADASLTFRPIALAALQLGLTCPATNASGGDQPLTVPLTTLVQPDGSLLATATLVGPAVVVAYQSLAHTGDAVVTLTGTYSVWRNWQRLRLPPIIVRGELTALEPNGSVTPAPFALHAQALSLAPQLAKIPLGDGPVWRFPGHGPVRVPVHPIDPDLPPNWVTTVDTQSQALPLSHFGTDAFRSRYTIATDVGTRPILNANDLITYAQSGTEFRELTSLGQISARYPSLRRAYLGQISGAVIAIPQSYGILRSSTGLAALLEAVADDSAAEQSGCRFEFSFTLAPLVDPVDLAQLAHDLATAPEATGRTLRLGLPDSIDLRFPSEFTGFPAAVSTVSDGPRPGTIQVHVQIADTGTTPAICNANLFLHQLASDTTPMTGTVAVRLDDLYPTTVGTSFELNLAATAGSDDLSLSLAPDDATTVVAHNVGEFDLRLVRAAALADDGLHATSVANTLAPDAIASLAAIDGLPVTVINTALALPDPFPPGGVFEYLSVHTETVTSVQHSLLYSASFDFGATGVRQLDVSATLVDLPSVAIPAVTLTALHSTDSVHAVVPLDALVTGLAAQVRVVVALLDGTSRTLDLAHDFVADPLMTLTSAAVAG